MAQASRDQNFVTTLLGVSNADGVTPVKVYADPTTHRLLTDNAGGGSGTVTEIDTTLPISGGPITTTGTITTSMSTNKLIGRGTAGTGVMEEITLGAGLSLTGTTLNVSGGTATDIEVGVTTVSSGTDTRILYDNAGVLGEYTLTGTGTVVAMQTAPTFVTNITTPIANLSATSNQLVFQSGGVTGTFTWTPTSTNKTATVPDRTFTLDNITTSTTTNGTGFLKGNGSVISFDNSTYITGLVVGTTTITSGTTTRILYDNAGTLGEYTITGSGTVVAMQTSPTFVTDITTPVAKLSATSNQLVLQSGGVTGTLTWTPTSSNKTITFPDATGTVALTSGGAIDLKVGTTTISNGTTTRILYDNAGVLGEYTLTGTGTVVAMQTAPSFLTSITTPSVLASSNDSGAIGASGTAFSDLFLASGAVINFAAGNYTLTHSSGILTANTDFRVTTAGTNSASVPTLGSTSTLTNKTLSDTVEPASDDTYTGRNLTGLNAGDTITQWDLVYLDSTSGRWEFADASAASTSGPVMLALAATSGTDGNPLTVVTGPSVIRNDGWNWTTVGGPLYVSETTAAITQTAPTTASSVTRVVGYALTDDCIYFNPSNDWVVHA